MDNHTPEATHAAPEAATPHQPVTEPTTVDNQMVMGILCYLGPLVLIPFLTGNKADAFLKFHLKQGLVLAAIGLIVYVLSSTMFMWGLWTILNLLNLGYIILSIVGIVYVVQNKMTALPVIGSLTKYINI